MEVNNLKIYKIGYDIWLQVYQLTKNYPKYEIYCMIPQIRRSAISIPSNIAEGYKRKSKKEFEHFLYISLGSIGELTTQINISKDLTYLSNTLANDILDKLFELENKTHSFIKV